MIKRIACLMLFILMLAASVQVPASAAGYSEALSIWPMKELDGYWYTNEYSTDSTSMYNILETESEKFYDYTVENNVWRASMSNFGTDKIARSNFVFVNATEKRKYIDLKKNPYLYYDFTMQDVMWMLTIRIGSEKGYAWEIDVPLQKIICKQEGKANLVDNSSWGVRGVYQGKISLVDAIRASGDSEKFGLDFTEDKIYVINGNLSTFQCYDKDVMEIRYIGIGYGERQYQPQTERLERVREFYEAKNVAVKGSFKEGKTEIELLDKNFEWKTNISASEMGALGSGTAYLEMSTDDSFVIKATGQSVKDKTYVKGSIVGWPKITAATKSTNRFLADNTYLVYDITAETGWDILIKCGTWSISLMDVLNSINKDNSIEGLNYVNGTRGYGNPGHYKGVLDFEEILNYYTINLDRKVVFTKLVNINEVTFIYENSNNKNTSYKNTINELKIVRGVGEDNLDTIDDVEILTTGVYKPADYQIEPYPEAESFEYTPEPVVAEPVEKEFPIWSIIAIGAAVIVIAGAVIIVISVKRRKKA